MSDNLIYRTYKKGDEEGILRLFQEVFGHDLTLPFWEWKNCMAPGGGPRIALAQEPEGKVVAAYSVISLPAVIRGEVGIMGQCVDIMVHPRHRGRFLKQGVLVKTFEHFCNTYRKREVDFLYGFPGRRHWVLGLRTGIYQGGGKVPFFKKQPVRQRLSTRLKYSFRPMDRSQIGVVDEIWGRNRGQFATGAIRSKEYVEWRFLQHPKWNYSLHIMSRRGGEPVAWCALRNKDEETLLMDFVAPMDFFKILVEKVEEVACLSGSPLVSVAVPKETPWADVLMELGYQMETTDLHYTTSFMGEIPPWAEEQIKSLFYTMGDMDIL